MKLTGKQKQLLKAQAHTLNPVVQIGHAGLTEAVVAQIDEALRVHELIKVKLGKSVSDEVEAIEAGIVAGVGGMIIQHVGRVLVVFRRNVKEPKLKLVTKERKTEPGTPSKEPGRQLRRKRQGKKGKGKKGSDNRRPTKKIGGNKASSAKGRHSQRRAKVSPATTARRRAAQTSDSGDE